MSGFGGILSAFNAIQSIGNVGGFGGTGGSDAPPVILGPVTFTGMEVPEKLTIGGTQALKIYKYPGGLRTIESMGRDDSAITWSGMMVGGAAEARILLLDKIRVSGQVVNFSFGTSCYLVVVSSFKGTYLRANYCTYEITVEILSDKAAPKKKAVNPLNKLLGNKLGNALNSITGTLSAAANTISSLASEAQSAIGTVVSTIGPVAAVFGINIQAKLQGITSALSEAQGVAGGLTAIANAPAQLAGMVSSLQGVGSQIVDTMGASESALFSVVTNTGATPDITASDSYDAVATPSDFGIVANVGDLNTACLASATSGSLSAAAGQINSAAPDLSQGYYTGSLSNSDGTQTQAQLTAGLNNMALAQQEDADGTAPQPLSGAALDAAVVASNPYAQTTQSAALANSPAQMQLTAGIAAMGAAQAQDQAEQYAPLSKVQ